MSFQLFLSLEIMLLLVSKPLGVVVWYKLLLIFLASALYLICFLFSIDYGRLLVSMSESQWPRMMGNGTIILNAAGPIEVVTCRHSCLRIAHKGNYMGFVVYSTPSASSHPAAVNAIMISLTGMWTNWWTYSNEEKHNQLWVYILNTCA